MMSKMPPKKRMKYREIARVEKSEYMSPDCQADSLVATNDLRVIPTRADESKFHSTHESIYQFYPLGSPDLMGSNIKVDQVGKNDIRPKICSCDMPQYYHYPEAERLHPPQEIPKFIQSYGPICPYRSSQKLPQTQICQEALNVQHPPVRVIIDRGRYRSTFDTPQSFGPHEVSTLNSPPQTPPSVSNYSGDSQTINTNRNYSCGQYQISQELPTPNNFSTRDNFYRTMVTSISPRYSPGLSPVAAFVDSTTVRSNICATVPDADVHISTSTTVSACDQSQRSNDATLPSSSLSINNKVSIPDTTTTPSAPHISKKQEKRYKYFVDGKEINSRIQTDLFGDFKRSRSNSKQECFKGKRRLKTK